MSDVKENKKKSDEEPNSETEIVAKSCFVIMPISDAPGYEPGHFKRVYEYIIKPACKKAGFEAFRADDVKGTNMIIIDILKKIISAEMAICDLSAKNPNVMYELGIRQSFDLPVTLMKDGDTDRVFDIQGFRDVNYSSSLRIDEVNLAIDSLAASLKETYENKQLEINSIVDLLSISKATTKDPVQISPDTEIILQAIRDINSKIYTLEREKTVKSAEIPRKYKVFVGYLATGEEMYLNDRIADRKYGEGKLVGSENIKGAIYVNLEMDDGKRIRVPLSAETLYEPLPF